MNQPIPTILHQIWYQGEDRLPRRYQHYRGSWRQHHPGWTLRVWDAPAMRAHIARHQPWFLSRYDGFEHDIQRIDAARYCLLDTLGGVYADMDIECVRPLDELLEGRSLVLCGIGQYNNALIGSAPGHALWRTVHEALRAGALARLDDIPPRLRGSVSMMVAASTGPRFFSTCVEASETAALPSTRCCPAHFFEPKVATASDAFAAGAYGRHAMDLNWQSPFERLISRLTRSASSMWRGREAR
ncbi:MULTISPECIES: glycosyltransferase family 32 protein [Burkholderia]|uniref:glycosyltransferase family 32 protein n=1 Tax=Burkholderia TaxID=32008 RepID=UPI0009BFDCB4|nr:MULTISPECIES: glycosyltransferase [Burkholderia]NBI50344.1 hypothetical protein [Burkholderia sp. ISTR5]